MDPMEQQLRKNYSTRDTEELIELRARDTLTETAYKVLDEILNIRGVQASSVDALREKKVVEAKLSVIAGLPVIESTWKGMRFSFLLIVISVVTIIASGKSSPLSGLGALIFVLSTLAFLVYLWKLAKASNQSVLGWMVVAIFVPLFIGKLIALYRMHEFVALARKKVAADSGV